MVLEYDTWAEETEKPAQSLVQPPLLNIKPLNYVFDVSRAMSIWPLTFGLACCAIEMMSASMARWDVARFGAEVFRPSARQADLMLVAGTVVRKLAPAVRRLYEQMPAPKFVLAMGNCAISGGPFKFEGNYSVVEGVDRIVPVDVYVPGCPPRPEALLEGIFAIQKKLTGRRFWPAARPVAAAAPEDGALNERGTLPGSLAAHGRPGLFPVRFSEDRP